MFPPDQADVAGDTGTQQRGQRIRVLCVDDHRVMLDGLSLLIGRQPDMEVVASATSGEEAVKHQDRKSVV